MTTAAPYLHVPSHHKLLPNGEFRNVNYDHTILGIRAGIRLQPWLSEREKYLTLAQAIWYVPQGLDVWAQLECGFPATTRGSRKSARRTRCRATSSSTAISTTRHRSPTAPSTSASSGMFRAIVDGDKVTAYRLFLGLAARPELRDRVRNEVLFAAIIDQQEFNSFRKVRHIGHKAIRTRSMLDIADWVGWDQAHPYFYIGIPDLCNAPIFHSLYDHASFMLGITFKGAQYRLHETNTSPLTEDEQDRLIAQILAGDPDRRDPRHHRPPATRARPDRHRRRGDDRPRHPLRGAAADAHRLHRAHARVRLRQRRQFLAAELPPPHQPKAVYLSAWFVTDTIREVDWYPDDPARRQAGLRAVPRAGPTRCPRPEILAELERTIAAQDPSRSVALVRSYQQRTGERDALTRMLVHCAGKFQGDAHIFRNARSILEEYYLNSASPRRKDVLFQAWAHYLSFYKKRTLSTECYDLYHDHFGT